MNAFKSKPTIFIFLLFLTLIIYFPALNAEYILDAHYVVANNSLIKQPGQWAEVFTRNFFDAYKSQYQSQLTYYRPVAMLSLALNYSLFGLDPIGFRLVNILLHALNAFLVFALIDKLYRDRMLSISCAFFFCILPVHEWVVNYVVGRGDLLQATFLLMSLNLLVKFDEQKRPPFLVLSLLLFALALFTRESSILFPLYVGVITFRYVKEITTHHSKQATLHAKGAIGIIMLFIIVSILYLGFRKLTFPIVHDASLLSPGAKDFGLWFGISLDYNIRYLIPWAIFSNLSWMYHPLFQSVILLLLMGGLVFYLSRGEKAQYRRVILLGLVWLMVSSIQYFPTRNIFLKLGPYLSEHFVYFSSLGFCLVLCGFLLSLSELKRKIWFTVFALFYIFVLIYANSFWTSEYALLHRVFQKERQETVAYQQLLLKYVDDVPRVEKMISQENKPSLKSIWLKRLGNIYRNQGRFDLAIPSFEKAINLNPDNLDAQVELAASYLETGNEGEGRKRLVRVIDQDPDNIDAHRILGQLSFDQGDFDHALSHFNRVLYLQPDDVGLKEKISICKQYGQKVIKSQGQKDLSSDFVSF